MTKPENFYTPLSRNYDALFPADAASMTFIQNTLANKTRILDMGCGTGNKTVLLAKPGRRVVGTDIDDGMIAAARTNHRIDGVDYVRLDMTDLACAFKPGEFDGIVCLGNTLVHLAKPGELETMLTDVAGLLAPEGVFVSQIVNYDRILDKGVTELPLLETDAATFTRRYVFVDGEMHFVTELLDKTTGEKDTGDAVLRPVRSGELVALLDAAGLTRTRLYGGYDGSEFTGGSFHLLAVASREKP